ncbi:hypothetical protein DLAC_03065 [Tieghemostelium lacteum]|uniref:F-box domain-containing protein n=1 Tax=Tieghemostelium lacteum TaxID=361077 RepID=A0A152A2M8_TIELA|nr:hypothetical protein DLAC_03065 [Tieghemostelium lacteum]|eukprot:KYR00321.1 hypothetical protein DLAC_03065 [Tieghemostelium lacteum]
MSLPKYIIIKILKLLYDSLSSNLRKVITYTITLVCKDWRDIIPKIEKYYFALYFESNITQLWNLKDKNNLELDISTRFRKLLFDKEFSEAFGKSIYYLVVTPSEISALPTLPNLEELTFNLDEGDNDISDVDKHLPSSVTSIGIVVTSYPTQYNIFDKQFTKIHRTLKIFSFEFDENNAPSNFNFSQLLKSIGECGTLEEVTLSFNNEIIQLNDIIICLNSTKSINYMELTYISIQKPKESDIIPITNQSISNLYINNYSSTLIESDLMYIWIYKYFKGPSSIVSLSIQYNSPKDIGLDFLSVFPKLNSLDYSFPPKSFEWNMDIDNISNLIKLNHRSLKGLTISSTYGDNYPQLSKKILKLLQSNNNITELTMNPSVPFSDITELIESHPSIKTLYCRISNQFEIDQLRHSIEGNSVINRLTIFGSGSDLNFSNVDFYFNNLIDMLYNSSIEHYQIPAPKTKIFMSDHVFEDFQRCIRFNTYKIHSLYLTTQDKRIEQCLNKHMIHHFKVQ